MPAAPWVAAEVAGDPISFSALVQIGQTLCERHPLVVGETAGGLLVPLTSTATYADLLLSLRAEVVLVVGNRLGCINHTLLTVEALRRRGIPLKGWVLNHLHPDPREPAENTNRITLTRLLGPPVAEILFGTTTPPESLKGFAQTLLPSVQ